MRVPAVFHVEVAEATDHEIDILPAEVFGQLLVQSFQARAVNLPPAHFRVALALHPDERHRGKFLSLDLRLDLGHQSVVQVAGALRFFALGSFPSLPPTLDRLPAHGILHHDHVVIAECRLHRRCEGLVRSVPLHVGLAREDEQVLPALGRPG